ncbi:hypothetical protein ROS9278_04641 [Roseomonas sp. CECT 9278]|nr:hypothetical protein ROS9278_04641 [Roseomonas sp. CECT 9278]
MLLAAGPALAQAPSAKPPPEPAPRRLPQVISPLDPPAQGRGLPRVISPTDEPAPAAAALPRILSPVQPGAPPAGALPNAAAAPCTTQQVTIVNAALVEARARIAVAIRLLQERPDHPHVRLWFGTAPPGLVQLVLQRTATRLASTAGVEFQCNDPARCTGQVAAYARTMSRTLLDAQGRPAVSYRVDEGQVLGVCPPFFRAGMTGTGTRWGILVHEATHFAAETRDHVYGRAASLALARENGARAAENADNFMLFVETLPGR